MLPFSKGRKKGLEGLRKFPLVQRVLPGISVATLSKPTPDLTSSVENELLKPSVPDFVSLRIQLPEWCNASSLGNTKSQKKSPRRHPYFHTAVAIPCRSDVL
uniref:Uncharacterized protein n=1 Tax=Lotharella globosa TaxID=91324 RepID=A0A6V3L250_9EUKA